MIYDEMNELVEELFEKVREIRRTKGREYATDDDTLADFKEVAAEAGITPLQCWLVYERKHARAIGAFCREGRPKSESIESRVLDVIVYHLLLLGLARDMDWGPAAGENFGLAAAPTAPAVDGPLVTQFHMSA